MAQRAGAPDFPSPPTPNWRGTATPSFLSWAGIGVVLSAMLAMAALAYGLQTQNLLLVAITPFAGVIAWPVLQPFAQHALETTCRGDAQRAAMEQQLCAFLASHAAQHIPHTTKRTLCFAAWRWDKEGLVLDALCIRGEWLEIGQHVPNPTLPMRPPYKIPLGLCMRWRVRHKVALFLDWPTAHAQMAVLTALQRRGAGPARAPHGALAARLGAEAGE